jgi:uncharacterized protein YjgD (DUF1641 family)
MSYVTVPKEEWEKLINEVKELRKTIEELAVTLKPILFLVEKLPHLFVDPAFIKTLAPILALPYAMEKVNPNVLGTVMVEGLIGISEAFEKIAKSEKSPEFSIMSFLRDKEAKKSLGIMMEILKYSLPRIHSSLKNLMQETK